MKNIQSIRGMDDVLPGNSSLYSELEAVLRRIVAQYGYREIRFPILEYTSLFARAIGEVTDVVEKEMYTFLDRNGDSLTLRPEGTAGCIRAGIEHGLFYNQIQRLFYYGPMFRYERPQKGRYRQFHQFGVEVYGLEGPDIDVEIFLLANRFWQEFKIDNKVELQINTLGDLGTREHYRARLVAYFGGNGNEDILDEDSKRRLKSNPLRILDSKNPAMQELIEGAPKIFDSLDDRSKSHFDTLCQMLEQVKLPYVINPKLVRGLDYYSRTVCEWVMIDANGAQNAVCAGGRYDKLVERLGGKPTPAIGFAIGLERLLMLVSDSLTLKSKSLIYLALLGDKASFLGPSVAERIRKKCDKNVIVNCGGGNLKAQLKRADKSGADVALILGEDEISNNEILVKYLRSDREQEKIALDKVEDFLIN